MSEGVDSTGQGEVERLALGRHEVVRALETADEAVDVFRRLDAVGILEEVRAVRRVGADRESSIGTPAEVEERRRHRHRGERIDLRVVVSADATLRERVDQL